MEANNLLKEPLDAAFSDLTLGLLIKLDDLMF